MPDDATAPARSLATFRLDDLAQFTFEKSFGPHASTDFRLLFVGRDDVHDALKYVLSGVTSSLYCNMFGFDDQEINDIIMDLCHNPMVTVLITLDSSQAGGVHEKRLLDADRNAPGGLAAFNTHFVVGQSATHRISHTKGFVADGRVGAEGSTNWSDDGEGTFVVKGQPGGPHFAAQNNTQGFFTCPDAVARFQTELIREHMTAQQQKHALDPERMNG